MTEPVAYIRRTSGGTYISQTPIDDDYGDKTDKTLPLYTKEQLHPRVKMTQKQYKEWQSVINSIYPVDLYELFNLIFNDFEHRGKYAGMRDIFSFDEGQKKLAQLWSDFDPDNPDETIEIVPTMKWFVETKNITSDYRFLKIEFENKSVYNKSLKMYATHFETQSQAESWVNPLTKAVQLPVEEQQ